MARAPIWNSRTEMKPAANNATNECRNVVAPALPTVVVIVVYSPDLPIIAGDCRNTGLTQRRLHALRAKRQVAQSLAGGVRKRVGDGGDGRPLRAFARTQRLFIGAIDQLDLDS